MPDMSSLDKKYIIDDSVFNCPYCNRNHVAYIMRENVIFDWSNDERCYAYFLECLSCTKISMHLSKVYIPLVPYTFPSGTQSKRFGQVMPLPNDNGKNFKPVPEPDAVIFYSVPTSFFTVDNRIPRIVRDLYTEAEGCQKSNFLTGASACIRKIVYELALDQKAQGNTYEERIKSLKGLLQSVDETYFDILQQIQKVTSTKVHESSYDGWQGKHVKAILLTLRTILHEIYVAPREKEERLQAMLEMKATLLKS
jgi:hypothetical protein